MGSTPPIGLPLRIEQREPRAARADTHSARHGIAGAPGAPYSARHSGHCTNAAMLVVARSYGSDRVIV